MISTVDPQAQHGHKTASRGCDGYKERLGIDPDSEIITATTVTSGNTTAAAAAEDLLGHHADTVDADADQADVAGHGDGHG